MLLTSVTRIGHLATFDSPRDWLAYNPCSLENTHSTPSCYRFLQRPEKQSQRRLSRTKSIGLGSRSDPESQADRRLWWMVFGVETGREAGRKGCTRIGFVEGNQDPSHFQETVKTSPST